MDRNEKAIDQLKRGITDYVDNAIRVAPMDKTVTAIVKRKVSDNNYEIMINNQLYSNVHTIGGECKTNETVRVLIPQNNYTNMVILKGGSGEGGGSGDTVNDGKLTIKVNDTIIQNFTANQSTDVTANIEVPEIVEITEANYNALPDTKYEDDVNYFVIYGNEENITPMSSDNMTIPYVVGTKSFAPTWNDNDILFIKNAIESKQSELDITKKGIIGFTSYEGMWYTYSEFRDVKVYNLIVPNSEFSSSIIISPPLIGVDIENNDNISISFTNYTLYKIYYRLGQYYIEEMSISSRKLFGSTISTATIDGEELKYCPDYPVYITSNIKQSDFDYIINNKSFGVYGKIIKNGIEYSRELPINSDWSETDKDSLAFIKNKPTIPTNTSDLENDSDFVTSTTVDSKIEQAIDDLPKPMIFKGSLGVGGTITTLPQASSSNEGYTYKVITDGTYDEKEARVGDAFISNGSTWVLIPSGDDPSGTVTSVGISVPNGLQVSNSPITESGTIEISYTNGYSIPTNAKQNSWDNKLDYDNPTGVGALSLNRKENSTRGNYSVAVGYNNIASGISSNAEGQSTSAIGENSHAEGYKSYANGDSSHAEGVATIASGNNQHTQGKYNIEDTENKYAHIVGNGTSNASRSNAHTLDWNGNAWFSGDVVGNKDGVEHKLSNKVEKESGKGLSTNDFTTTYKNKIDNLPTSYAPTNAERNVIVGVQKNGTDLTIDSNRKVNVTVPTQASDINAVPTTRKINNHALSADITITPNDIGALASSEKGAINGVATLGTDGKVPNLQLPTVLIGGSQTSSSTADGGSNIYTFTKSDGTTSTLTVKNGSKGSQGDIGAKGDTGAAGKSVGSATQTTSSTASSGKNTVTFKDTDGVVLGSVDIYNGAKGDKGDTGAKGDKGDIGSNGISCTHSWNGTILTVTSASGTSSANLKGDKGDPGQNATTTSVVSTSANGLAPKVTDTSKFLKGDGTWATPTDTNTTYSLTQDSTNGHKITLTPSVGSAQTVTIPDTNTTYTLGTNVNSITLTLSVGDTQSITAPYASRSGEASYLRSFQARVDGTNDYPYHRIASTKVITSDYVDRSCILLLTGGYVYGNYGIVKIDLKTNNASAGYLANAEAKWLVRKGFNGNQITIGYNNTSKNSYLDVYYVSNNTYASITVTPLFVGGRGIVDLSAFDFYYTRETSTEIIESYSSITTSTTTPRVYTNVDSATDGGTVAISNRLTTTTIGNATTPIYLNNGYATALNYTIAKSVPSDAKFTDTNTTYTFASGDSNGQIKVTPSGGTAQNISVKGLGSIAYKNSLTSSDVGLGNVGNFKAVSTVANQGLTETEKANARANIGVSSNGFSGSYNDLTNKPYLNFQQGETSISFELNNASTNRVDLGNKTFVLTNPSPIQPTVGYFEVTFNDSKINSTVCLDLYCSKSNVNYTSATVTNGSAKFVFNTDYTSDMTFRLKGTIL